MLAIPACECGAPLHDGPHEDALIEDAAETIDRLHRPSWFDRKAMLGDLCQCDHWLRIECDCYPEHPACLCTCHDEHGGPVA